MKQEIVVRNQSRGGAEIARVLRCASFLCRMRGLMLRSQLPNGVGLLLVGSAESRLDAAIHMLAMRIDLGVVWLDDSLVVVDVAHAHPWRVYVPKRAARYVIEAEPAVLQSLAVGDQLQLGDANTEIHPRL